MKQNHSWEREAVGSNPTDRGENGSKGHMLVDAAGAPLSLVVRGEPARCVAT
jgi:hypothetical protein